MTNYTLGELADTLGAVVQGDDSCTIQNIASIIHAKVGDITFLGDKQYQQYLGDTKASAVLLSPKLASSCPVNALVMANPKLGFIQLLRLLRPAAPVVAGIHPTAVIGDHCQIDPSASIAPQAVIEDNVTIGPRTVIGAGTFVGHNSKIGTDCCVYSRVSLYHHTQLADRVVIHSGVVIGADGFGLAQDDEQRWVKIPQVGCVVIGNDSEVGANTTIDRGTLDDTVIGNGVKIDNLVMIAHNVRIGDHTAIAGCSGIAGSTTVGRHCMLGASAGLNGHISLCDHTIITGMGMINRSITEPGVYSSGTGMQKNRDWHKSVARFHRLDDMAKRLKKLEKEVGK